LEAGTKLVTMVVNPGLGPGISSDRGVNPGFGGGIRLGTMVVIPGFATLNELVTTVVIPGFATRDEQGPLVIPGFATLNELVTMVVNPGFGTWDGLGPQRRPRTWDPGGFWVETMARSFGCRMSRLSSLSDQADFGGLPG